MAVTVHEYPDVEQRSDEWAELRRGIITASTVKHFVSVGPPDGTAVDCPTCEASAGNPCVSRARKEPTPIKTLHPARTDAAADLPPVIAPADNDTSKALTLLLVAERITGWTDPTFTSYDMLRGVEHEAFARDAYSEQHDEAREYGFMVRQESSWRLGWSPDGLVGDDGAIEIKAPRSKEHVRTVLADEIPAAYMPQCQAALLVSGREWIDFVSFVGGMPLYVKRVTPDVKWQAAIIAACQVFEYNAAQMVAAYEQATAGLPLTERVPDFDLGLVF